MTNTESHSEAPGIRPRTVEEHLFAAPDGVRLFYRHWPAQGRSRGAVLLLHRGHEHSGRVAHLPDEFGLPDYAFFALDARAHGRSEGVQGPETTMATFVQDLDDFVRHLHACYGYAPADIAVVAQSIGAVIAAAWIHDYGVNIRCLVLASPAFRVKLYVPFARPSLALGHTVMGNFFVQSYVKGSALTHDRERAASYATDPLIRRPISVRVLLSLDQMAQRVVDDAAAIRVPTQMLISGSDWVVRQAPQRQFYERLGTSDREWHVFDGFLHDTLGERDRHLPIAKARAFVERHFAAATKRKADLAAGSEFTWREYETLRRPLPWWTPKGLSFAGQKLFLQTLGKWSDGIRLGGETGFDSGATLDYVYRNQTAGFTPLGRLFDWFYLNSTGWSGVRVRRRLLEDMLVRTMMAVREQQRGVRILDIAAGHGRYVLDAVERSGIAVESILLRDFSRDNVRAGSDAITRRGLNNARFIEGDSFDAASLAAITPQANVAIVSGFYELFPDNAKVSESLRGVAAAVERGGFLLYTGQPWHPQLEMIARTLKSHRNGEPWIMRRRTQEELDQLVEAAGFRKVEQRIDPNGLFTVSRAERL